MTAVQTCTRAGPEQQELDRVLPGLDAADAADRHVDFRVVGDGGDHVQGDRLDGRAAVAAVAALAADGRLRGERVEVHAHDRVDGVDERQGVGPAADGRPADGGHVADVRRQLHHHRNGGDLLDPFGDHAGVVGHLADGRAHAALAHAVRAAEVQFDAVGPGVLRPLRDLVPGLAVRFDHERDEQGMVRIRLLDAGDLAQVVVERAVGDEFDVVEAEQLSAVVVDAAVARGDVDDRLEAERLPDGAAPAGVERPADLVLGVGRRRRREPERVRAL